MELMILGIFCMLLVTSVLLNIPLYYALFLGLLCFWFYGTRKGFTLRELLPMTWQGSKKALGVLQILLLIGMLTGIWRACGTIPAIVLASTGLFQPALLIPIVFLLNSGVSFLIGTSFGTAATMGTICMAIASMMGANLMWVGGAVMSGIYFGDRCSPLSSSAALVASSTETELYTNIRGMMKTGAIPFLLTLGIYLLAGRFQAVTSEASISMTSLSQGFQYSFFCFLPALLVLILILFRVPVKVSISFSIAAGILVGLLVQHMSPGDILSVLLLGFHPDNPELAMLSGGGMTSMFSVILVVLIASGYSVIFEKTGLMDGVGRLILIVGEKATPFTSVLLMAILTVAIACNQSLPTILLGQLCREVEPDRNKLALAIENTVIVLAPMIPWSIACSVPIATIGATSSCLFCACYLYLIPSCELVRSFVIKRKEA